MGLFGSLFGRSPESRGPSPERQKEVKQQKETRDKIVNELMDDPVIQERVAEMQESPSEQVRMQVEANRTKLEEAVDSLLAEGKTVDEAMEALADSAGEIFGVSEVLPVVEGEELEGEDVDLELEEDQESGLELAKETADPAEAFAREDADKRTVAREYLLAVVDELSDGEETLKEHIQGFEGETDQEKMDNFIDSQLAATADLQLQSVRQFEAPVSKADKFMRSFVKEKLAGRDGEKKAA